jgi:predicted PurR-regulated permease PerM
MFEVRTPPEGGFDVPESPAASADDPPPAPAAAAPKDPLPRGVVVLLGMAGAVIVAAGLRGFSDIAGPVFLALVLTIAMSPLRSFLIRHGTRRWLAGLVSLVAVNAILLGLAAALAYSLARLATLLPKYEETFAGLVDDVQGWLADRGIGDQEIQTALHAFDLSSVLNLLQSSLSSLLGVFSDLGLIVVLLFFMGLDAIRFTDRMSQTVAVRPGLAGALLGFARGTTRYLIVSSVFGLIVALVDVGVLYLLGIPLPWVWGLLAFITNYIPNVGFFIGLVPPALLGLLDSGWETMLWVIVAYSVINFIIQSLIQPKVVGDAVGLSTTLTFLSLVFWAWVLGPLGAILAIPLSLLTKALLVDADPSTAWLSGLISSGDRQEEAVEPAPAEPGAAEPSETSETSDAAEASEASEV